MKVTVPALYIVGDRHLVVAFPRCQYKTIRACASRHPYVARPGPQPPQRSSLSYRVAIKIRFAKQAH